MTREDWRSNAASTPIFHSIYHTFDNGGRLIEVKEQRNSGVNPPQTEYVFTYDDLDRLLTVTDTANRGGSSAVPANVPIVPVNLSHSYDADGDLVSTQASIGYGGGALVNDFRTAKADAALFVGLFLGVGRARIPFWDQPARSTSHLCPIRHSRQFWMSINSYSVSSR